MTKEYLMKTYFVSGKARVSTMRESFCMWSVEACDEEEALELVADYQGDLEDEQVDYEITFDTDNYTDLKVTGVKED